MKTSNGKDRGFTLIELMIVIVVLGLLAAIAYPSFMDQIRKARRSDAKEALHDIASRAEMYYQNNERYPGSLTTLGFASASSSTDEVGGDGYYVVSLTSASNFTYTISATPTGAPRGDQDRDSFCTGFTLNHLGEKTPDPASSRCW